MTAGPVRSAARALIVSLLALAALVALPASDGTALAAADGAGPAAAPAPATTLPPASVTTAEPADDPAGALADPEGAADPPPGALQDGSGDGAASPPTRPAGARPTTAGPGGEPPAGAPHPDPPGQADPARVEELLEVIADSVADPEQGPRDGHLVHRLFGMAPGPSTKEGYDLGASVTVMNAVWSAVARLAFTAGKVVVAIASWMLEFTLRFDLGVAIAGPSGATAARYADLLDSGRLPLRHLALLAAVAHAAWLILRHRPHAAVPEVLVSLAIALTGGYLLANADGTACTGLSVMGELTTGMVALAHTDPTDTPIGDWCADGPPPVQAAHATEAIVTDTFVEEPFMVLQWGVVPAEGTACRTIADALVDARPWGDVDLPREVMADAGCHDMVAFNRHMTTSRVLGAHVYALCAVAFGVAVVLAAGTLLVAQVAGALLVLVMPFAVVAGIAPGAGRSALARWGHAVLKVGVLFVGSGFALSAMAMAISAVQSADLGEGVVVRMLLSTAIAWSMVLLRGRVLAGARQVAHDVARGAAGGRDVGPVGRGVAQTGAAVAHRAADVVYTAHAGAVAARTIAGSAGAAAGATLGAVGGAVGGTATAVGRASLLTVGAVRAARRHRSGDGSP